MRKFVICYASVRFENGDIKSISYDVLPDGFESYDAAQNYLQTTFAPSTQKYLLTSYPTREVSVDYGRDGNVRIHIFDKEKIEGFPYYEETLQYTICAVEFRGTGDVNFTVDEIGNFVPLK